MTEQVEQTEKTSIVLDTAATLIEIGGWRKGAWGQLGEGMCLEGGIAGALGIEGNLDLVSVASYNKCPAYKAVREHINAVTGRQYGAMGLAAYNDRHSSTKEEIVATLRTVASKERAAGR